MIKNLNPERKNRMRAQREWLMHREPNELPLHFRSASGPTSPPIRAHDEATAALIREAVMAWLRGQKVEAA